MFAAKEGSFLFKTVADDTDAAMGAGRRKGVDRAFEAIEGMGLAALNYLKRLVVIVSASLAYCHDNTSLMQTSYQDRPTRTSTLGTRRRF